jgi:hypothetical protein
MRDLLMDIARAVAAGFEHGRQAAAAPSVPLTEKRTQPPLPPVLDDNPHTALKGATLVLERHAWSDHDERCACGYTPHRGDPSWFEHCAHELAHAGLLGPIALMPRPLQGHAEATALYRLARSLHFLDADPGNDDDPLIPDVLELDHAERLDQWANLDAEHLAHAMANEGLALIRTRPERRPGR